MNVSKLERARHILGAQTDTETVERALDAVIFQGEVFDALDRLAEAGGLSFVYPSARRSRRTKS